MIILRDYQKAANSAARTYLEEHDSALVVMPTGSGKAGTIGTFIKNIIDEVPDARVLSLVHNKKLVRQNLATLIRIWPDAPVSVYSAGLKQKKLHGQIVCASIQSIYAQAYKLQKVDVICIDEGQMIPHKDTGMYRRLISELLGINPHMRIVMWTATPFRTDTGRLDEGEGALCDGVAYELGLQEAIDLGWLCPLATIPSKERISVEGIKRVGGEFNQRDVALASGDSDMIMRHAEEMVSMAFDRKHWIVFEAGVKNAMHMSEALNAVGVVSRYVHSGMDDAEIEDVYKGYEEGHIHAVTNADMLTVGADFPKTNFLGVRRPTDAPGLWIQICGRGTRVRYEDGFDPGLTADGALDRKASIAMGPKPNCIAEGQNVLTDFGLVPIESVEAHMKVWDGIDFVSHCGVVFRGEREVIEYAGIHCTPDHLLWTSEGWKEAISCKQEATPIAVGGRGWQAIREADGYFRSGCEEGCDKSLLLTDEMRLRNSGVEGIYKPSQVDCRVQEVRATNEKPEMAFEQVHICQAEMHKSERLRLGALRCKGDKIPIQDSYGYGYLDYGEFECGSIIGDRPNRQQRKLRTWKSEDGSARNQSMQQEGHEGHCRTAQVQNHISGSQVCRLYNKKKDRIWNEHGGDCGTVLPAQRQTKRRVWDILNCGPRNRFVCEGLIVHNCLVGDFAGNAARHGPLDQITGKKYYGGTAGKGEAPQKDCPQCEEQLFAGLRQCPFCDYEFPPHEIQLLEKASRAPLLSAQIEPEWLRVTDVTYHRHRKPGKPDSVRVDYQCSLVKHSEWITLEHGGYVGEKGRRWWAKRSQLDAPLTVDDALTRTAELAKPVSIRVIREGKYTRVIGYDFGDEADRRAA